MFQEIQQIFDVLRNKLSCFFRFLQFFIMLKTHFQVQGLDEESARVIVMTAPKGETLTVNEFLLLLVTKEEYAKFSKVLS